MPQAQPTGGKKGKKNWTPPSDPAFAEVDLNASKDGVQRVTQNDDLDLSGDDDDRDDGDRETPQERRAIDRSKLMTKRLNRQERVFNQRQAEAEARHQREIAALTKRIDSLNVSRQATDVDEAAHNREIEALQKELEDAYEKGNTKEQARLTTKIAQLQGAFESKKRAAMLGQQQPAAPQQQAAPAARTDAGDDGKGPTREARRFMKANDDWWDDPEFVIEKHACIHMDQELMDEGSDPDDPEHYEELARRMGEKFPNLEITLPGQRNNDRRRARDDDDDDDDDDDRGSRSRNVRRPPVPSFNDRGRAGERNNAQRRQNGRTVTLSRNQRENMERFGLDPSNDDHVKEYAKSAEETDRAYQREGR